MATPGEPPRLVHTREVAGSIPAAPMEEPLQDRGFCPGKFGGQASDSPLWKAAGATSASTMASFTSARSSIATATASNRRRRRPSARSSSCLRWRSCSARTGSPRRFRRSTISSSPPRSARRSITATRLGAARLAVRGSDARIARADDPCSLVLPMTSVAARSTLGGSSACRSSAQTRQLSGTRSTCRAKAHSSAERTSRMGYPAPSVAAGLHAEGPNSSFAGESLVRPFVRVVNSLFAFCEIRGVTRFRTSDLEKDRIKEG